MTATFDFDRLLESVLDAGGPQSVPSTMVEAALTEARALPQRRPLLSVLDRNVWPAPRHSLAHPATARLAVVGLVIVLTLAFIAAAIGIGSQLIRPDPVPTDQLSVISQLVDAINVRDADAFTDAFAPGVTFGPGGDFRESSSLFGNSLPLADASLVEAWMAINDAWDLGAELIACTPNHDAGRPRYADGDTSSVDCEVATRRQRLSLEVKEHWSFEFAGAELSHWGFGLLDLNPPDRVLPLGYDGLEAWEAWLAATDPGSAARYLNPRSVPGPCDGCSEWVDSLAPGDPERAAQSARLLSTAENDWSIRGHDFAPFGLIPYDPAFADEIEASIREYLGGQVPGRGVTGRHPRAWSISSPSATRGSPPRDR